MTLFVIATQSLRGNDNIVGFIQLCKGLAKQSALFHGFMEFQFRPFFHSVRKPPIAERQINKIPLGVQGKIDLVFLLKIVHYFGVVAGNPAGGGIIGFFIVGIDAVLVFEP